MRIKVIFFICFLTLLATSCSSKSDTKKGEFDPFLGFEGIDLKFSSNAPSPKVFENSYFPVLMKVQNKGAYTVKDKPAYASVSFENDYVPSFTLVQNPIAKKTGDNEISFTIEGKTELNQMGEEVLIELNAKAGSLEQQSEQKDSSVSATVCYPYTTTLSTTVCIDPDITGIRQEKKVCSVKEILFSNGQGAPIAVTKIESFMLAEADENNMRPQFLIFVENRGNGNPVNINSYRNICSSGKSLERGNNLWNVAFLRAYSSGNVPLQCAPGEEGEGAEGYIKFRDGKDYVRCTFKEPVSRNAQAYTSPLRIEIDYGYVKTESARFMIQKTLRH